MDLLPTPEQEEIVTTVRAQLERRFALNDLAANDGSVQVVDRTVAPVRRARLVRTRTSTRARRGRLRPGRGVVCCSPSSAPTPPPGRSWPRCSAPAWPPPPVRANWPRPSWLETCSAALAEAEDARAPVGDEVSGRFRVTDHGVRTLLLVAGSDPPPDSPSSTPSPRSSCPSTCSTPLGVVDLTGVTARASVADSSELALCGPRS